MGGCACNSVKKRFLPLLSDSAGPPMASLECQSAHTITLPSRPMSVRNDRSIQGSGNKELICAFRSRITLLKKEKEKRNYETFEYVIYSSTSIHSK